jgi:hypothetical protein
MVAAAGVLARVTDPVPVTMTGRITARVCAWAAARVAPVRSAISTGSRIVMARAARVMVRVEKRATRVTITRGVVQVMVVAVPVMRRAHQAVNSMVRMNIRATRRGGRGMVVADRATGQAHRRMNRMDQHKIRATRRVARDMVVAVRVVPRTIVRVEAFESNKPLECSLSYGGDRLTPGRRQ